MSTNRLKRFLTDPANRSIFDALTDAERADLRQMFEVLIETGSKAKTALADDETLHPDDRFLHPLHIDRLTRSSRKVLKILR